MKKYLCLMALALVISACGSTKFYTFRLQNIRNTEPGTIYLESTGVGKSENDAYNNAAYNAFNAVLFKGIPGSVQASPMIDDETKARADHAEVLKCFTNVDCYNKFVAYSEKVGAPVKTNEGLSADLKIKINIRTLKTYLEQNSVVRKFGF